MASAGGQSYQYKLVLLGDSAVGKSSLVLRFVKKKFFEYQESTIGAAFMTQSLMSGQNTVKFEIWDTAGQERYHSLAPMYYRGAAAAIVVYDLTNRQSFVRAKSWVKELQKQGDAAAIALCGNKKDLEQTGRQVHADEAKAYADENGIFFFETSAKENINVTEVFLCLAENVPRLMQSSQKDDTPDNARASVQLVLPTEEATKKPCCG